MPIQGWEAVGHDCIPKFISTMALGYVGVVSLHLAHHLPQHILLCLPEACTVSVQLIPVEPPCGRGHLAHALRVADVQEELLATLSALGDFAYGWGLLDTYVPPPAGAGALPGMHPHVSVGLVLGPVRTRDETVDPQW